MSSSPRSSGSLEPGRCRIGPLSYWDLVARVYDWQLALERPAIRTALELLRPCPEERLLDLGTGTGALLRELALHADRPAEAIGVDASREMLARVGPLPPGWRLLHADAADLPFPDGRFDVAAAAYLLHILDEEALNRALREVQRVLVPGGRLVTVTPTAPRSSLRVPYRATTRVLEALTPLAAALRPFDAASELTRAGLRVAETRYVARGYPSLCVLAVGKPAPAGQRMLALEGFA